MRRRSEMRQNLRSAIALIHRVTTAGMTVQELVRYAVEHGLPSQEIRDKVLERMHEQLDIDFDREHVVEMLRELTAA